MAKKARTPPPPRRVQAPQRRVEPSRRALAARGRLGRGALLIGVGAAVVVAAIVVGIVLATRGGGGSSSGSGGNIDWVALPGLQKGPPPWNNGSVTLQDRLPYLGLRALSSEGLAFHIHQHLDLYVNGKKVTVPQGIGIYDNSFLTELHTHTSDGVLHVESPDTKDYHLGQLFGEWGVKLTDKCVGRYCGKLSWWVDGKKQTGDPAKLVLKSHQEIVVALGTPPTVVPSSYKFAEGE